MSRPFNLSFCFILMVAFAAQTTLVFGQDNSVSLFNGKDLTGWLTKEGEPAETLKIGTAKLDPNNPSELVVEPEGRDLINFKGGGRDFYSEAKYGDALIEVEFMVPKGSNSGVYVMGEYEVQIFDSFGKSEVEPSDVGGLYGAQAPSSNASKAPGEWQKFEIAFRAPKFDKEGKKTANACFMKVALNGKVIHEMVEMKGPTPGGISGKEAPEGSLMFQGNHGPVAYRNIKITPVKYVEGKPSEGVDF
jgi:3-keto-disaccharide hydrolase